MEPYRRVGSYLASSAVVINDRRHAHNFFAALYKADGTVEAPRGATVVQAGTTVLLVSRREEVARAVAALTGTA